MYKQKKPLTKRPWFIILMVIVVLNILVRIGSESETETNKKPPVSEKPEIVYTDVDLQDMLDLKNEYPMKAEDFKGTYIRVSGYLDMVDNDGNYFTIVVNKNAWSIFDDITWYMSSNPEAQEFIKNTPKDTYITIEGKITSTEEWLSSYGGRVENVY